MAKRRNPLWPFGKLTGVSTPVGGVSWNADDPERDAVRALIVYLEERTTLYADERPKLSNALKSLSDTRTKLTETISAVPEKSPAVKPLRRMRQAITNFLQNAHEAGADADDPDLESHAEELAELRGALGSNLADIVQIYKFEDVESCLAGLFRRPDEGKAN